MRSRVSRGTADEKPRPVVEYASIVVAAVYLLPECGFSKLREGGMFFACSHVDKSRIAWLLWVSRLWKHYLLYLTLD